MPLTTKFADHGTSIHVLTFDDEQITPSLKPGVYTVQFNPMSGFYLSKKGPTLPVPEKIYGSVSRKLDKILNSYANATKSFGVLLSGDKGSGKTMTSSLAANFCITELKLPVILIEGAFDPCGLTNFIEKLGECVLFIDEFGKKFRDEDGDQGGLLGLFDGTGSGKRLVLLTENSVRDINTYMLNRPGRVHYHFRHDKLDESIVREFCADNGIPDTVIEQICLRREASTEFSFDVLQAIVNEYNQFKGDIVEICDDLNIERPFSYNNQDLDILEIQDITANCHRKLHNESTVHEFPSARDATMIHLTCLDDEDDYDYCHLSVKQIVKKEDDVYTFAARAGSHDIIVKAKSKERKHNWSAF